VYTLGINRFGQLGQSNLNIHKSLKPIKIDFPMKDHKIIEISIGDNHNIMLSSEGELFGNGDNSAGQIDGNLDNFLYYYCSPKNIILPDSTKIVKIWGKNNRSACMLENGKVLYWGGFSYHPKYKITSLPKYNGFNIMNNEVGLPENCHILDLGIGFLHDILLIKLKNGIE
jgi:alpha-tubulin suppressor-like RCC1 family protein